MDLTKRKVESIRDGVVRSLKVAQAAQEEFEADGDEQRVLNQQYVIERLLAKLEVCDELLR